MYCRSHQISKNAEKLIFSYSYYLPLEVGFDTAENGPQYRYAKRLSEQYCHTSNAGYAVDHSARFHVRLVSLNAASVKQRACMNVLMIQNLRW